MWSFELVKWKHYGILGGAQLNRLAVLILNFEGGLGGAEVY